MVCTGCAVSLIDSTNVMYTGVFCDTVCNRHNSMQVDEGINRYNIPAKKKKARTVVGRGEKSLPA